MSEKILSIGEILWDEFPRGEFLGGAPFNVACHLNMLSHTVTMASRIGNDQRGRRIIDNLRQRGMSTDFIQQDPAHNTGRVTVSLSEDHQPSYTIANPSAWDFIENNDDLTRAARHNTMLVFGSLAQRNPVSRKTIQSLLKLSRLTVFDINLRPPFVERDVIEASLHGSHILKLNEAELELLSDWFKLKGSIKKRVALLAKQFICPTICVTRGSAGAALHHLGVWSEHPGYAVKVKDTVGAGDAFLAAMLHGILEGFSNARILAYANAVGAYVAGQQGATPILDIKAVRKMMKNQPR